MMAVAALALLLAASPKPPLTLYVGPVVRGGFVEVDKGIRDSIEDIKTALWRKEGKKRGFKLVDAEDGADLKLYVVQRGEGPPTGDGSTVTIPGAIITSPNGTVTQMPGITFHYASKLSHVAAILRVGTYERGFVGESEPWTTGTWARCARLLVDDLLAWLTANRDRLSQPASR
jgi:hypothetical protein